MIVRSENDPRNSAGDLAMKRSRRVVLTMMGSAAVGAVSMGFVRRADCPPGTYPAVAPGPDGQLHQFCRVSYGGFGGTPYGFHGHFHAHGGG
jgi:hypothetical protein